MGDRMSNLSLYERLKQRKIVQRGLAYLAGAFVVFQAVEVMRSAHTILATKSGKTWRGITRFRKLS